MSLQFRIATFGLRIDGVSNAQSEIPNPKSRSTTRRLDLDVDARRKAQLVERFDCFGGCLDNINQTLVRANLELLPRLLIDVRAAEYGVALDPGGERNGSVHHRIGSLGRVDYLCRT